jgi:hypothetical protein
MLVQVTQLLLKKWPTVDVAESLMSSSEVHMLKVKLKIAGDPILLNKTIFTTRTAGKSSIRAIHN